jgi:hypothetical protein
MNIKVYRREREKKRESESEGIKKEQLAIQKKDNC